MNGKNLEFVIHAIPIQQVGNKLVQMERAKGYSFPLPTEGAPKNKNFNISLYFYLFYSI